MKIEYNETKNAANIAKHGVSFELVVELDWSSVISQPDDRNDYGEIRVLSYGLVNRRLYTLIWTARNGNVRPISFRKANKKEVKKYEKKASIYQI